MRGPTAAEIQRRLRVFVLPRYDPRTPAARPAVMLATTVVAVATAVVVAVAYRCVHYCRHCEVRVRYELGGHGEISARFLPSYSYI